MGKVILTLLALIVTLEPTFIGSISKDILQEDPVIMTMELLTSDVTATVYNATASQCNSDYLHTASMFEIDPEKVSEYRIIAIERTMMTEYGIAFGDLLVIEGAGEYDGVWQVQDLMNKRYKGQHRIDFLVPSEVRLGKWEDISIYRLEKNN